MEYQNPLQSQNPLQEDSVENFVEVLEGFVEGDLVPTTVAEYDSLVEETRRGSSSRGRRGRWRLPRPHRCGENRAELRVKDLQRSANQVLDDALAGRGSRCWCL